VTASDAVGLLAGAVAGRPLAIAAGEGPPCTDGVTLWVPDGALARAQTAVVVQAGLVAARSLEPRLIARLVGRRSAAQRFLALEARRLCEELGHLLPPVAEAELRALAPAAPPSSAQESLRRALDGEPVEADPWIVGILRPSAVLRARGGEDTGQGADKTSAQRLDRLRDLTEQVPEEADEAADQRQRDQLTSPLGRNPLARLLQKLMDGTVGAASSDGDGGMELPVGGARAVRDPSGPGRIAMHAGLAVVGDGDRAWGTAYPEWDVTKQRYLPAHCVAHHMDPSPAASPAPLRMRPDPRLQQAVSRLGLALERHRRQPTGDGLDLRALVDFGVARAAGERVDPRVYEVRRPTAHDLGVLVLLDASGSTAQQKVAGDRIWDEQRRLAAGLVDALEQVGDRVAAYGFRSHGREDVRFLRIKHFDDRFDRPAERRLTDLQPAGYTRLGAALRHGTALAQQDAGTSRQLLLLISDGLPYEQGYESRYAEADSRRALQEAVGAGVGCVCISVGTLQDPDALERVWGAVHHLHVASARDVAPQIERLVRGSLQAALGASHGLALPLRTAA